MRFCGECGGPLVAPETLPQGERKTVTVLFCDLVGSTARADGADPEDVQAGLAAYQSLVRGVLERHGAAVEKFIGDAVMAVFGAPVAHEDDAERAVRAGLSILAAVQKAGAAGGGPGFAVRIGVATGEVLVNLDARPELGQTLVAGDLVNTAARLQTSAEPGTVATDERTYQLTRTQLAYAPLLEATVKGKAAPLRRWQATEARSHPGAEAGVRSATRFVGRKAEVAAMEAAYERVVAAPAFELVLVGGEPGVGKSRLVAEFFTWIDQRPELVRWRQGRCLPYGDRVTFHALSEIVKAEAGILDSDDEQAVRGKLTHTVAALTKLDERDRAWVTARLAPLAGLPGEGGAGKGERFTAWRRFLEALAAEGPLVLVVEDAHWADAQLLAFLGHLAEWSEGVPVLLVVTARPELAAHAPEFGTEARAATRLNLSPLDDADAAALLAGLLDAPLLDADLQAKLLERAGGNPLFAEQIVALLADRGALTRHGHTVTLADPAGELPVPDSLSALITARLDTLPRPGKALLGDAAVFGRVFWSGAVAALSGRDEEETRGSLRGLAQAGFVARLPRASVAGQAEYRFSHALVRDAAYNALPRALRGARHAAAADWLESRAGERADTAEVVAYHAVTAFEFAQARGDHAAAEHLRVPTARRLAAAGDRAMVLDVGAAERHYAGAVSLLGPGDPERAATLCMWGRASRSVGRPEQAQRAFAEALTLARDGQDSLHAGAAMYWLGRLAEDRGDPAERERLVASAVAILERLPPGEDLLRAYRATAFLHTLAGRPSEALTLTRRLLELAPADSPWTVDALVLRAWARSMLGDPSGVVDGRKAIELARRHAPTRLADTLSNLAEDFWVVEGPEVALTAFRESQEVALRQGSRLAAALAAGSSLAPMFDLGLWDDVLATASEWRPQFDAGLGRGYIVYLEPYRAAVLCWRGALAEAHQYLDPVLPTARKMTLQGLLPALAAAATLCMADGNRPQALSLVEEYEQALSPAAPASWFLGWRYLADIVRACIALGELDRAQRLIGAAEPALRRHQLQMASAKAAIAEAADDPVAALLYTEAAGGWRQYGHALERGLALLGLGRCRKRAGHPEASAALFDARATFAGLGAAIPLAEADNWLAEDMKHTS